MHIENIPNVFVFKKTPVSKRQASIRHYEWLQKQQKRSSSNISSRLMLLMKAEDRNSSIKSRIVNFRSVFLVSIYISKFCEFKKL